MKLLAKTYVGIMLLVTGCAQHHCRHDQTAPLPIAIPPSASPSRSDDRHVFVYKYDGSLQCKQGKAVALEKMAESLKPIQIFAQKKSADGLMHIQMCGASSGMANLYEISEGELPKAEKLGFKKWTFE